jgi:hypothetical protein
VTTYRIPPPARSGPATAAAVERWLCGIAASYERWPREGYTFVIPPTGLPLYTGHEEQRFVTSGIVGGDVGAARRFAEVDGVGLVTISPAVDAAPA